MSVPRKISQTSKLFENLLSDFQEGEAIQLDIDSSQMQFVLKYAAEADVSLTEGQTDVGQHNKDSLSPLADLLQAYDCYTIKSIMDAAIYLQIQSLIRLCTSRIATELTFENNYQSFEQFIEKYNIVEQV